ncbi:putative Thyrotropin-releasing hormone receptor [Hypsibius exemplaris]|uniref:Thyrotropin-releasing hormone receptor n=1 Tax=Hypsibius exemplaris TaxID=2072580 RepID=A0A1W0WJP8_HYPEX|nr:putative Thyrotropin-releasing hormone receptor [Hypsibius exemplaris]
MAILGSPDSPIMTPVTSSVVVFFNDTSAAAPSSGLLFVQPSCLESGGNGSAVNVIGQYCEEDQSETSNPLSYKIVATVMHVLIFLGGVFGNVVLILVVRKTSGLQTPTYCYLVSLAYADLIVLFSAVPEAIVFHHARQWILGHVGCSVLIFSNFLGINAGSLSILAFTIERYIAVMRPMLSQRVCTVGRAKKVIIGVWIFSILYCAPWLGLTQVKHEADNPSVEICDFRISADQYFYFFTTDLVLFYVAPLLISAVVYSLIFHKIRLRDKEVDLGSQMMPHSRSTSDVNLHGYLSVPNPKTRRTVSRSVNTGGD